MTFKQQYKVMIAVMVLLGHAFIANAQDDEKRNTGESLGKQYLNNRVPGLQYAPEKPKALRRATVAEQAENHSESSGMQLKKGTIKEMRFAQGAVEEISKVLPAVRPDHSQLAPLCPVIRNQVDKS
ncbi:hypothetical protein [Paraflavitalea speifideaquila]|uniref:hypothetical protein n=1 Tax=Paraflavitalea speifideaquila TaxID=3076558 RepID=UPI0028E60F21|nr:hypothetical protein [Paraflavitalea speifideiaquila]